MIYLWQMWVFILVMIIIILVLPELLVNWLERKAFPVKFIRKVYCKNCKHCFLIYNYISVLYGNVEYKCKANQRLEIDFYGNKMYTNTEDCLLKNINQDCLNYERKWYKFWVK